MGIFFPGSYQSVCLLHVASKLLTIERDESDEVDSLRMGEVPQSGPSVLGLLVRDGLPVAGNSVVLEAARDFLSY